MADVFHQWQNDNCMSHYYLRHTVVVSLLIYDEKHNMRLSVKESRQ